ncbi:TonB-dependent receptor [Methylomonas sp. UP202]|uniref:TonB-dependent receptor n=1 Tax=Methylomonas sp. UP202 TaxID=3040943 RepID=UPI00247A3C8C|nr:TonB-dependent receptor [Methylomonas sp. UP202]WGS85084.1 TonB-dependent receptor [Methylomonas sp. UP202]
MSQKSTIPSLVMVAALGMNPAYAADEPIEDTSAVDDKTAAKSKTEKTVAKSEETLSTMVITATRTETDALFAPANVSVINEQTVENRLTQRIGDALKDVPGVYLRGSAFGTAFPGSSVSSVTLHGITGSNRSLFMVDGLPINNANNGVIDWNMLNMDDSQQVEYVPGPFSALYGGSAMGGVINVISKVPTKREGKITVGAGGEAVDQWGIKGVYRDRFANGLGVSLTVNHMDSDNWAVSDLVTVPTSATAINGASIAATGAQLTTNNQGSPVYVIGDKGRRPWEQNTASLHLYYDLTPRTQIDGGMAWSRSEISNTSTFNSYLTRLNGSPLAIGTGASNINIDGRRYNGINQQLFLQSLPSIEDTRRYFGHLKHDFGHETTLNVDFQYLDNITYSPFANATDNTDTVNGGVGQLTVTPNQRIDGNVALRFPFLWEHRNYLTVGFAANHSTLENQQRVALSNWRDWNSVTGTNYLSKGESSMYSAYIQDEVRILDNLTGYLGLRYDDWSTSGQVTQNTAPRFSNQYQERSYGQFNPKFSLVWLPADGYKFFASTGWSFRPPTNFELYSTTQTANNLTQANPALTPETMYSWEIGSEITPIKGTTLAATYFHHYLSDLVYTRNNVSRLSATQTLSERQNVGKAEVDGIEVKLRQQLYWDWLHFTGTYALTDSVIKENLANPASVGAQMIQTPNTQFSAGLDFKYDQWRGGLLGRYVSQVFNNDQNLDQYTNRPGSYDPYFLLDTRIGFQATKNIDLSFSVNNLLDRQYSSFYLQAGRTVYGEISYSF